MNTGSQWALANPAATAASKALPPARSTRAAARPPIVAGGDDAVASHQRCDLFAACLMSFSFSGVMGMPGHSLGSADDRRHPCPVLDERWDDRVDARCRRAGRTRGTVPGTGWPPSWPPPVCSHFVVPGFYERIVPKWFGHERSTVRWSGVAEICSRSF